MPSSTIQHNNRLSAPQEKRVIRHDIYRKGKRIPVSRIPLDRQEPPAKITISGTYKVFQLTAVLLLIVSMLGLFGFGSTMSFYGDTEAARGNVLATGSVDFVLEDTPFSEGTASTSWAVDVVPEDLSNPFYYHASSTNFSGDLELCEAVIVTATLDGEEVYSGPLTELLTGTTTSLETWTYHFTGLEDFAGQTCHFEVDYNGWQTRHDLDQGGYNDTETAKYWLTVPSILITKVYLDYDSDTCTPTPMRETKQYTEEIEEQEPAPETSTPVRRVGRVIGVPTTDSRTDRSGTDVATPATPVSLDTQSDPETPIEATPQPVRLQIVNEDLPRCDDVSTTQEWVEIYNLTNQPIDINGWSICDGNACDMLTAPTAIAAGGFGLIAGMDTIHTEISIPWDVTLMLVPDGQIGDGLHASGDMLQLRNPDSLVMDQLNWGEVDLFWTHYTSSLWPTDALLAQSGSALARIPVDSDTNQPTDFTLLGVPALIMLEPASTTVSVMAGETFDITWSAINQNGPDEDLKIDIYYFDDTDGLHVIVLDTENDGLYEWSVPDDLEGPIRIKIVATGPENPLLNVRQVSPPFLVKDPNCELDITIETQSFSTVQSTLRVSASSGSTSTASSTVSVTSTSTTSASSSISITEFSPATGSTTSSTTTVASSTIGSQEEIIEVASTTVSTTTSILEPKEADDSEEGEETVKVEAGEEKLPEIAQPEPEVVQPEILGEPKAPEPEEKSTEPEVVANKSEEAVQVIEPPTDGV